MVTSKADTDLARLRSPRRYWEDLSVAVNQHLDRKWPETTPDPPGNVDDASSLCSILVTRATKLQGIRPWEFWRTIPEKPLLAIDDLLADGRFFEDQGRAMILAFGFRLLGGVSPFLLAWLGVLACLPVLMWVAWEFGEAGHLVTAAVYCGALACSPYFVDCLSLPHSGVGFYLISIVTVTCVAIYGVLNPHITTTGLVVRTIVAGAVFALCALCRSGTLLEYPGFALALALGYWRLSRLQPRASTRFGALRTWAPLAGLLLLFPLPYLLVRPTEHHFVWSDIWKGLGDFDRKKIHPNKDGEATKALRRAGAPLGPDPAFPFVSPETEAFFRRAVLNDVRTDPMWFAHIISRRTFATLTQERLWPMTSDDGRSMALSSHPNEGNTDKYYRMTTTADWLGLGSSRVELPILLLAAPLALLALLWLAARWSGRWPLARRRMEKKLLVLSCTTAGSLGLPVLITTAGGMETQAFAMTYLLAWGLAIDGAVSLLQWLARRVAARAQPELGVG